MKESTIGAVEYWGMVLEICSFTIAWKYAPEIMQLSEIMWARCQAKTSVHFALLGAPFKGTAKAHHNTLYMPYSMSILENLYASVFPRNLFMEKSFHACS